MMDFNKLSEYLSVTQKEITKEIKAKDLLSLRDNDYYNFLEKSNGGFFFNNALHMYSLTNEETLFCISTMNLLMHSIFQNISKKLTFIGQDIFGNQFAFEKEKIVFFNIETTEIEQVADNFVDFVSLVIEERDYYTGESLLIAWEKKNSKLDLKSRLCPVTPFIIGGEYSIENLYKIDMEKNLEYHADLANQIKNLPDGTPIKLIIHKANE